MLLLALASTLVLLALLLFLASSHNAQIPGALHLPTFPLVGHAFLVQNNPARQFMAWARKYQRPSFVIRLGTRPVLVVNSHSQVSELWLRHSQATGSRPLFHTFHNVVSATQGFTVGLTPAELRASARKSVLGSSFRGDMWTRNGGVESWICIPECLSSTIFEKVSLLRTTQELLTTMSRFFVPPSTLFWDVLFTTLMASAYILMGHTLAWLIQWQTQKTP